MSARKNRGNHGVQSIGLSFLAERTREMMWK